MDFGRGYRNGEENQINRKARKMLKRTKLTLKQLKFN